MKKRVYLTGLLLCGLPMLAQDAAAHKAPEYEVVSVRPSSDTSGNMMLNATPDGYKATGTTVKGINILDAPRG